MCQTEQREAAEARARAAAAAAERQAAFDKSAQGRAAKKAVLAAKEKPSTSSRDDAIVRGWQE